MGRARTGTSALQPAGRPALQFSSGCQDFQSSLRIGGLDSERVTGRLSVASISRGLDGNPFMRVRFSDEYRFRYIYRPVALDAEEADEPALVG